MTLPLGIATAVSLEEFQPRTRRAILLHSWVQLNISNLAGVPSVVYGILGLTAFAGMFHLAGSVSQPAFEVGVTYFDQYVTEGNRVVLVPADGQNSPARPLASGLEARTARGQRVTLNVVPSRGPLPDDPRVLARTLRADAEGGRISDEAWYYTRLPLGRGVLTGALTLMLVVLPIVILASQEALRAVPRSLRDGALGLGATPWQAISRVTLPAAVPGILTGAIIAMSRAIGEAAPILMIAGIVYITSPPRHMMDDFSVMPLQIYNWAQRPNADFHEVAATGIIVLLGVLFTFNAAAVVLRHKLQKPLS